MKNLLFTLLFLLSATLSVAQATYADEGVFTNKIEPYPGLTRLELPHVVGSKEIFINDTTLVEWIRNLNAQVAGSDTQLQFNNSGDLGASGDLTFNGSQLYTTKLNLRDSLVVDTIRARTQAYPYFEGLQSGRVEIDDVSIDGTTLLSTSTLAVGGTTGLTVSASSGNLVLNAGSSIRLSQDLNAQTNDITSVGNINATTLNVGDISFSDSIISTNTSAIVINDGVDMSNNKITRLADPTTAQDAATKAYVDANAGGSPGGSTNQIQYNNGGDFGGNAAMTFNGSVVDLDASGGVNIEGFTFNGANQSRAGTMTFSTSTGNIEVNSAGTVDIDGTNVQIENLTVTGSSVQSSGNLNLRAANGSDVRLEDGTTDALVVDGGLNDVIIEGGYTLDVQSDIQNTTGDLSLNDNVEIAGIAQVDQLRTEVVTVSVGNGVEVQFKLFATDGSDAGIWICHASIPSLVGQVPTAIFTVANNGSIVRILDAGTPNSYLDTRGANAAEVFQNSGSTQTVSVYLTRLR